MAKLNENQILLAIAGVTVLMCGGAGSGIWWAKGIVEEETTAIDSKRAEIAAARTKIKKIKSVEDSVIVLRENVHEYVKILPQQKEVTTFMRAANTFAAQAGISVDNFAPVRQNNKKSAFQRVVYKFEFQATVWQFLKFVNFFENHERFVKVRDIRLSAQRPNIRTEIDPVHSVGLTVETYVYNSKGTNTLVAVPNYANKRDTLRHKIHASLQTLSLEKYEFKGQEGRRDIFLDPRDFTTSTGDIAVANGRIPSEQQKRLIENYSAEIEKLQRKWEMSNDPERTIFERYELKQEVTKGISEVELHVSEVSKKSSISAPALRVRWFKEVLEPLKKIKNTVANLEDADEFLGSKDFKKLIEKIKQHLVAGELDAAIHQYDNVRQKIEVPPEDPRYKLRIPLEGLIIRARVAKEFSAMPLKISGVLVNQNGKSGLILNGKVYEEGEFVSDQLFIKSVRREEVEFVYKSFTLVKTW